MWSADIYKQICIAVACRMKSIGHACRRNGTCANTCDLHVVCSVQIMRFAIVHKTFIGVCNLCGKYFSLMEVWRNICICLHGRSVSMFRIVTATKWDVLRWVVSLKITLGAFLAMAVMAVSDQLHASTPLPPERVSGTHYRGPDKSLARTNWKKQLKGRHFSSYAEVIAAAETWLDGQTSEFFFFEWLANVRVWSL